jgi:hypothetical protein
MNGIMGFTGSSKYDDTPFGSVKSWKISNNNEMIWQTPHKRNTEDFIGRVIVGRKIKKHVYILIGIITHAKLLQSRNKKENRTMDLYSLTIDTTITINGYSFGDELQHGSTATTPHYNNTGRFLYAAVHSLGFTVAPNTTYKLALTSFMNIVKN